MKRFINYLMEQKREDDLEKRALRSVLVELSANVEQLTSNNKELSDKLGNLTKEFSAIKAELKAAYKKAQKYEELYNRAVQELYGTRQNRVSSAKKVRKGNQTVRTAPVPGEATAPTAMTSPSVRKSGKTMTAPQAPYSLKTVPARMCRRQTPERCQKSER